MFIDFINFAIIIVVIVGTYFSIKLLQKVSRGGLISMGWWAVLPVVLIYSCILRVVQFLIRLGVIDDPYEIAPALFLIFYIGLVIFIYGLYKVTCDLIRIGRT